MDKRNIVIIGMMGAGKSHVSRELSRLLDRRVISTDQFIEKKEGQSVAAIFKEKGEAYFRRLERAAVQEIAREQEIVVDCGGGIVLYQENIDDLKKNGVVVYLMVSPEVVLQRIKNTKTRPMLNVDDPQEKIRELLVQRGPRYAQADHKVNTDGKTIAQICREVIDLLSHD